MTADLDERSLKLSLAARCTRGAKLSVLAILRTNAPESIDNRIFWLRRSDLPVNPARTASIGKNFL
ncbi:hypothetical protein [Acidovorax sp.]|uniref:hypothetical protein n=1 Tax=Acidovorax sp. TaxID=1872122 RepID=UPI0039E26FA9